MSDYSFDYSDEEYSSDAPEDLPLYANYTMDEFLEKKIYTMLKLLEPLHLTTGKALTLLQLYNWSPERLLEAYLDGSELLTKRGLLGGEKHEIKCEEIECFICCDTKDASFGLSCGHVFCVDCYRRYVEDRLVHGSVITCPSCEFCLDNDDIETLTSSRPLLEASTKVYIKSHSAFRYCPATDCHNIVECVSQSTLREMVAEGLTPLVKCGSGHTFCFSCNFEDHSPSSCGVVKSWIAKCKNESETANWILANTKECPKCSSNIEKNGGCNHMSCKECKYEFCWICMGPWDVHGNSYYQCTRYSEHEKVDEKKDAAKRSIKKYTHYYNLFNIHENSMKLDWKLCQEVESRVRELQVGTGISWIEGQFLAEAAQVLADTRRILKWSYPIAFYSDGSWNLSSIFEDNQALLSNAVEALSKLFKIESPEEVVKSKMEFLNRAKFAQTRAKAVCDVGGDVGRSIYLEG